MLYVIVTFILALASFWGGLFLAFFVASLLLPHSLEPFGALLGMAFGGWLALFVNKRLKQTQLRSFLTSRLRGELNRFRLMGRGGFVLLIGILIASLAIGAPPGAKVPWFVFVAVCTAAWFRMTIIKEEEVPQHKADVGAGSKHESDREAFQKQKEMHEPPPVDDTVQNSWFRILEVSVDASWMEISAAYKRQVRQYHPDKVATLGIEIRSLAEAKTKQINAAYDYATKLRQPK